MVRRVRILHVYSDPLSIVSSELSVCVGLS